MTYDPLRIGARALAVAALLVAPISSAAQAGRVEVSANPTIPFLGAPASAIVRFLDDDPTQVSVFVRPVGSLAYQEIAGTQTSPRTFSATLPEVPPQGIEAYAEYVLNGVTFTEPEVSPEDNPYRIPTFHPRTDTDTRLPARQYRMVTIPLLLDSSIGISGIGSDEPDDVLGDDFGEGADPSRWRLLRFDPLTESYADYAVEPQRLGRMLPGRGFWLITATGGFFDVQAGLSAGVAFKGNDPFPAAVVVDVLPGWNQIGSPFLLSVDWDDVLQSGQVEDPVAFRGGYVPAQTTLTPWEGYFVFNRGSASQLTFQIGGSSPEIVPTTPEDRLLARAGDGAGLLRVRLGRSDDADAVFLGRAGDAPSDADRLMLRKPPAVTTAPRLVGLDGGDEWASQFVGRDDVPRWVVEIRSAAPEPVSLDLDTFGAFAGAAVRATDLDRGVALPVADGRVTVQPVAGVSARRIELAVGAPDMGAEPVRAGTPFPNPSVDRVAIPLTLASAAVVRATILDARGRTLLSLPAQTMEAGTHEWSWDGRGRAGQRLAAGVYWVRLSTDAGTSTVRVTLLR